MKSFNNNVIDSLMKGYTNFRERYYHGTERKMFERLTKKGQKPKMMIIGCSDSRVDPSAIFDTDPGDIFVVRNVANLVPPCDESPQHHATSSALEFAVKVLKVEHIILMGHSQCGGIRALMEKPAEMGDDVEHSFILHWMEIAEEARKKVEAEAGNESLDHKAHLCERKSLEISYRNLMTFPWIKEAVQSGKLQIHAWVFDLETGLLSVYDPATQLFEPLQ